MFAGNFAPVGWLLCQGQTVLISDYETLFNLIGTTYGGNGVTTFALPDLRGRAPINSGQGPGLSSYVLGQALGVEQVTLTANQMPAHNHVVYCNSAGSTQAGTATLSTPALNYPGTESSGAGIYEASPNNVMNAGMVANVGNSQPHENMQPYLAINFIIAWTGIYPNPT